MKNAFDKVWHIGMIFKLNQLGISGLLLDLFHDYFLNRYQRVGITGQNSEWKLIPAGVSQCSVV